MEEAMASANERYGRTNLLQENDYNYTLQDVEQANLFEDMFDYDQIPEDHLSTTGTVPMHFPGRDMDHGHHLPRRPAGPYPLLGQGGS